MLQPYIESAYTKINEVTTMCSLRSQLKKHMYFRKIAFILIIYTGRR